MQKDAKKKKTLNEREMKEFIFGQVTKTAHLMKIVLFKDNIRELLDKNRDEKYIIGYVGCNKAAMVLGGFKGFAAILTPEYFKFSTDSMDRWTQKKKDDFRKLREEKIKLTWAIANGKIDALEYDTKTAKLDEEMSKMRSPKSK